MKSVSTSEASLYRSHAAAVAPAGRIVRAGPLTAELVGINLRSVRIGDLALVQRIYVAIRDPRWNVVPARTRTSDAVVSKHRFDVWFTARHLEGDLDFAWDGHISGSEDGRIRYSMDGTAKARFDYNKIGLLVLHPLESHFGRRIHGEGGPGGPFSAVFPHLVAPQVIRDGALQGFTPPFRHLAIQLAQGTLDLDFEGDDFELEDERNWTESGFKTYSGPLARPWPVTAVRGTRVAQAVTLSYRGSVRRARRVSRNSVTVGHRSMSNVPLIGHSIPQVKRALSPSEVDLLSLAKPCFLHADIHPMTDEPGTLEGIHAALASMQAPLFASLYIGENVEQDVGRFVQWHNVTRVPLQAVMVLDEGSRRGALGTGTSTALAREAIPLLRALLPNVVLVVGSDRYLSEVIRSNPALNGADALAFGITPSGHADEDWALIENLAAQSDAVLTLRSLLGPTPIIAGPVTLQPRFGSWPRPPQGAGHLPPQIDRRQRTLIGAAWTLGSVSELTAAGASSAIFYETAGWAGLFERESGGVMPTRFSSFALEAYPMFHVFADLSELRNLPVLSAFVHGPIAAIAFGVDHPSTILLANLSALRTSATVGPLQSQTAAVRVVDRSTLGEARRAPVRFRQRRRQVSVRRKVMTIDLDSYAYARIDLRLASTIPD